MSSGALSLNEAVLDIKGAPLDWRYARILKALNHLMTVRTYYSPEHEQYAEAALKACATIVESIGERPAILIEIGTEGMMLGGQTVEAGHREVRQLHDLLVPLNIARLEIDRGLTADDLRTSLEILHGCKLDLGSRTGFQEITINGLPATVRTVGCKLFSQDENSADSGEGTLSLEDLASQFLDLVGEIITNMEPAVRNGGEAANTGSLQTGTGRGNGSSGGHLPADLQQLAEALRDLAKLESDPQNFLTLIQNAQKALDISRDPNSVDLVFRLLRKELGKSASVAKKLPTPRIQDPDQQRERVAVLRSNLAETIADAGGAGDIDLADTRGDYLGICFRIMAANPSPSLEVHLLAALELALGSADTDAGDVRLCARWLADGMLHKDTTLDQDLLQAVLKPIRAHHLELLSTFWLTLWGLLDDKRRGPLWPYLVNDVLLGTGQTPAEETGELLKAMGSVDTHTARSGRATLFRLSAFRCDHGSGIIFSVPPAQLHAFHAVMLESPLADWHAPRLQKLLLRGSPHSLVGIVMRLLGDLRGENSALVSALLGATEQETLPHKLSETVVLLLADGLPRLPRGDRDQVWVTKGLEWLNRLDHETAIPVLKHVWHDKRFLFFRAWPPRCREAAERMMR